MRPLLLCLLAIVTATTSGASAPRGQLAANSCPALTGADEALSKIAARPHRFVIIGEAHGTAEFPELFGDLACRVAMRGPILVSLELAADETPRLQAYLASDGTPADRAELLKSYIWDRDMADGRSSRAMLALIERLRRYRAAGLPIRIFGGQPVTFLFPDQRYYDLAMAARWAEIAATDRAATVLILAGSFHARLTRGGHDNVFPAAANLSPDDILSFRPVFEGGAGWNVVGDQAAVHTLAGTPTGIRRITLAPDASGEYSGTYSVGRPATPSPPARD